MVRERGSRRGYFDPKRAQELLRASQRIHFPRRSSAFLRDPRGGNDLLSLFPPRPVRPLCRIVYCLNLGTPKFFPAPPLSLPHSSHSSLPDRQFPDQENPLCLRHQEIPVSSALPAGSFFLSPQDSLLLPGLLHPLRRTPLFSLQTPLFFPLPRPDRALGPRPRFIPPAALFSAGHLINRSSALSLSLHHEFSPQLFPQRE